MLYLDLPTGDGHGWGIVGDSLAHALAALTPTHRLTAGEFAGSSIPGPLLENCWNSQLRSRHPRHAAPPHIGYVVFEDDALVRQAAARADASAQFDLFVTACRWCEKVLRDGGLQSVVTVPHGVNSNRFNPARAPRTRLVDRFVVFSGGKLEFRKAQDVAVRAFQRFASRHADALLLAAWHNPYGQRHASSMAVSPYLPYAPAPEERFSTSLDRWLTNAGLTRDQFELVPPMPNAELAGIYGNSDVGLFPNRCEGATNLVMMEYMACGKPVIATAFAGHCDVLTDANSLALRAQRTLQVMREGLSIGTWCEPDVDEVVERLEEAYQHRDRLHAIGARASSDMSAFTWMHTARRFVDILGSWTTRPETATHIHSPVP